MSKYQKALNKVVENSCPRKTNCQSCEISSRCNCLMKDEIDLLQELVDKNNTKKSIELECDDINYDKSLDNLYKLNVDNNIDIYVDLVILGILVEKEKPKKPIKMNVKDDEEYDPCEGQYYECPNCKTILPINYEYDHAIKNKRCDCGQALDWSEE